MRLIDADAATKKRAAWRVFAGSDECAEWRARCKVAHDISKNKIASGAPAHEINDACDSEENTLKELVYSAVNGGEWRIDRNNEKERS